MKNNKTFTKDLYVDTIHFTQNNSSMSTASSGGVSGNYIPMTGTSKDDNNYVKSPVTGTVHMKNNNGWDLLNTNGYEVTVIPSRGFGGKTETRISWENII